MTQAQQWLDNKYNNKQSGDNIRLFVSEELSGEVVIKDYTNTREINLIRFEKDSIAKGKIAKVTISNCPVVERIILGENEIASIVFEGDFPKLTQLEVQGNQLKEIELSKLPNLEFLNIARNPIDSQGIEKELKNLTKLKLVHAPGFNLKNIADDHTGWINPDDIKNALGIKPSDPLPNDWKDKLDDLRQRPTQEDLKNAEDKYKDYINPNNSADKAKLEQAAKNAGFIDPKDLESEAKKKGMVSKAEYDKVVGERNARPNIPLNDWNNDYSKRPKQGVLDEIQNKIKGLLGINSTAPLPNNWMDQLTKRADLDAAKKEIESLKSKLATGGSGTGATLTPIQQKKIEYFGVMASYLYEKQGNWKQFIDKWKKENEKYVERTQAVIEQPLNK